MGELHRRTLEDLPKLLIEEVLVNLGWRALGCVAASNRGLRLEARIVGLQRARDLAATAAAWVLAPPLPLEDTDEEGASVSPISPAPW